MGRRGALRSRSFLLVTLVAVALPAPPVGAASSSAPPARPAPDPPLQAAPAPPAAALGSAGDSLRVFLVTIGPGELVWERFGHNAIWIHDPAGGTDLAYNWGMFSFDQQGFLPRLLRGTMLYWMAPFPIDGMISAYVQSNRSVWVQELAIAFHRRVDLQEALRVNALPENAYYRYDYYRDNCSTRVRDALDHVLDGRLEATLAGVGTGTTYRSHTRRLLQDIPSMYTSIQLVLSHKADQEIDRWQEAFLPVQLMEAVREVRVPDGTGGERPLVVGEREAFRSTAPGELQSIPSRWLWYFTIGAGLALILLLLADPAARGHAWARVPLALLAAAWSAAAGVAGVILLGAWLFTDHVFWYPNENLLQMSPISLGAAVLALPLVARRRPPRWAVTLAATAAGLSLLGVALEVAPGFDQQNGDILALTAPANLGVWAALAWVRRSGVPPRPV